MFRLEDRMTSLLYCAVNHPRRGSFVVARVSGTSLWGMSLDRTTGSAGVLRLPLSLTVAQSLAIAGPRNVGVVGRYTSVN